MNWTILSLVMAGGALGAGLRYWLGEAMVEKFGAGIPWSTLAVNLIGSFFVGLVFSYLQGKEGAAAYWRAFLIIGVLGALTTYSSIMLEALIFARFEQGLRWVGYFSLTLTFGLLLVFAGARVGDWLRT